MGVIDEVDAHEPEHSGTEECSTSTDWRQLLVVHCLGCEARYNVANDRVTDRGGKIDCPRCSNTFVVFRDSDVPSLSTATREAVDRISFEKIGVRWEVRAVDGTLIPFSNLATLRSLTQRTLVAKNADLRFNEGSFVPLAGVEDLDAYFWDVFERSRNGHLSYAAPMMTPVEGSPANSLESAPSGQPSSLDAEDNEATAIDLDPRIAANIQAEPSFSGSTMGGQMSVAADTSTEALPEPLGWETETGPWVLPNKRGHSLDDSGPVPYVESTTGSVVVLRASQHTLAGGTSVDTSRMVLLPVLAALLMLALALAITLPFALQQLAGDTAPTVATISAPPASPAPRGNQSLSSGVVVEKPEARAEAPAPSLATQGEPASSEGGDSASKPQATPVRRTAPTPKASAPARPAAKAKAKAKALPAEPVEAPPSVEPEPAGADDTLSDSTPAAEPDPFAKPTTDLRDPFAN